MTPEPVIRALDRREIDDVWSIDRSELIEAVFRHENGCLVRRPARHDVRGWPPGEPELYGPKLRQCLDHGGSAWGVFEGDRLLGAAVLERRFIGRAHDRLQLVFLHVSRRQRGAGLGVRLFERAVERARTLGARQLYVSATPSEHTVRFYLRRGCRVTDEVDAALFALEPEDIHLELDITA